MKINKSKEHLAAKIKSSGFEWPSFGKWATQDKDGEVFISGGDFTPVRLGGEVNWEFGEPYKSAGMVEVGVNWFQCILSRAEYFHLYPAPDADGWIEWNGGECPVERGAPIDVRFRDGTMQPACDARCEKSPGHRYWTNVWSHSNHDADIIAYRLHKLEQAKSEFCESVMRSIPEPDANPTIEQLAADYRNKLEYADRKQDEADKAKIESDAALSELEKAIAAIGFAITPIGGGLPAK